MICTKLSRWWTQGPNEREDVFWRTAGSGARAKTRGRKGRKTYGQSGDVCAIDPIGDPLIDLFSIELKRGYNRCSIMDLMDKGEKAACQRHEQWFAQAEESHKNAGSFSWWLIVKRDHRDPLIFMPNLAAETILDGRQDPKFMPSLLLTADAVHEFYCTKLDLWLEQVTPKLVKELSKRV